MYSTLNSMTRYSYPNAKHLDMHWDPDEGKKHERREMTRPNDVSIGKSFLPPNGTLVRIRCLRTNRYIHMTQNGEILAVKNKSPDSVFKIHRINCNTFKLQTTCYNDGLQKWVQFDDSETLIDGRGNSNVNCVFGIAIHDSEFPPRFSIMPGLDATKFLTFVEAGDKSHFGFSSDETTFFVFEQVV